MLGLDPVEPMTEEECLALLATERVGRVSVSMSAMPVILPVRFSLVGRDILVAPGADPRVCDALTDTVVAFEAGHFDPADDRGWSVMVVGWSSRVDLAGHDIRAGSPPVASPAPAPGTDERVRMLRPSVMAGGRFAGAPARPTPR